MKSTVNIRFHAVIAFCALAIAFVALSRSATHRTSNSGSGRTTPTSQQSEPQLQQVTADPRIAAASRPGGWAVGHAFAYSLHYALGVTLEDPMKGALPEAESKSVSPSTTANLVGTLEEQVLGFDEEQGTLDVCARLVEAIYTAQLGTSGRTAERSSALEQGLAMPVRMSMRTDGEVLGFWFPPSMPLASRSLLAQALALVHGFEFRPQAGPWDNEQIVDRSGRWVCTLRSQFPDELSGSDTGVVRERVAYSEPVDPGSASQQSVEVLGSHSTATLLAGWIDAVHCSESLRFSGVFTAVLTEQLELKRIREVALWGACTEQLGLPTWPSVDASPSANLAALPSFETLVEMVLHLAQTSQTNTEEFHNAVEGLATRLVHDSALLERVRDLLHGRADDVGTSALLCALARASGLGSEGAPVILADVMREGFHTPRLQCGLLMSAFLLDSRGAAVFAPALLDRMRLDMDGEVRDQALLTLGGLSSRLAVDTQVRADIEHLLREERVRAEATGSMDHLVRAWTQSGNANFVPDVLALLEDPRTEIQESVALVANRLDSPQILGAVVKKIWSDAPLAVRVACVEGMREVRDLNGQRQALLDVFRKGDREELRLAALQAMDGIELDEKELAELRTARDSDASELVRSAARNTLVARGVR